MLRKLVFSFCVLCCATSISRADKPVPGLRVTKYFPPVSRIDAAYGDRNLVCACPPVEAYA